MKPREKLEARFHNHNLGEYGYFDHATHAEDMAAADAMALEEHVKACCRRELMKEIKKYEGKDRMFYGYSGRPCGQDKWYCKDAPKRPE